jgi:NAD(P)-dependent dehydrogenase (short-subunit alcohol dehydrogenase family)
MLSRGPQIDESAIVITGASSGIGRATAQHLAEEGADLVLAARSAEDLDQAADECAGLGAAVLVVPTEVGSENQVQALAEAAEQRFGRIDAWINNAGVIAYGGFEEMPSEVFDEVIRTNLLGQVYGARAALAQFRRQGSGVLVNLSSVWGRVTSPYVVPYVVSKHGIRAFSECLRQGLIATEGSERIHVCTVLPESVDTPIFQHAANYTRREAKPVSPVIDTDRTARAIVRSIRRPRGERSVGQVGHAVAIATGILPGPVFERIAPKLFEKTALDGTRTEPDPGNVFAPEPELNRVRGGWRPPNGARVRRAAGRLAALGASVAAVGLISRRARHKG